MQCCELQNCRTGHVSPTLLFSLALRIAELQDRPRLGHLLRIAELQDRPRRGYIQRRKASSWIPLLGGSCGAFALAILPLPTASLLGWLPLLLDWGSVPGLLDTLIFHLRKRKIRRNGSE